MVNERCHNKGRSYYSNCGNNIPQTDMRTAEDARGSLVLVVNDDMDERSELRSSTCDLCRCLRCFSLTASTLQASRRPGAISHPPCLPHAISVPARDPCGGPRPHALVRLHHGHKRIRRAAVSPARLCRVLAQARSVTVPAVLSECRSGRVTCSN